METTQSSTINLRIQANARDLIDRAAAAVGKSRTEFMIEAARREAETVLLDKCYFALGEKPFKQFMALLDQPPAENSKLRRLLRTKAPWD